MRSFSAIEKRWIRQIIGTDRVGEFFGNLLDPSLNNSNIKIDYEGQTVFVKSSITDDYVEMGRAGRKLLYIEKVLIELTELIGFLESQGLVIIYKLVDNAEGEFGTLLRVIFQYSTRLMILV